MAHVGNFGPVHFRRDLSLNVPNYNIACHRFYKTISVLFGGTIGTPLNLTRFKLLTDPDERDNVMEWISAIKVVGGVGIYQRFSLVPYRADMRPRFQMEIFDDEDTLLFKTQESLNFSGGYTFVSIPAAGPLKDTPGVLFNTGVASLFQVEAMGWKELPEE